MGGVGFSRVHLVGDFVSEFDFSVWFSGNKSFMDSESGVVIFDFFHWVDCSVKS